MNNLLEAIVQAKRSGERLLAVLVDPDKFDASKTEHFLQRIPDNTTHILVGGSAVPDGKMEPAVLALKKLSQLPILLFPGSFDQLTEAADGLLFLILLSGRNPEYLVGQQVQAMPFLRNSNLQVMPTAYVLIDGGNQSAVARVTQTKPMDPTRVQDIVDTAKAGELMGAKLVYLEAGSGALNPVPATVIKAVSDDLSIPIIVGGGIKNEQQKETAYKAGATMVVVGTALEEPL